jgi:hypothetical protein
LVERSRAKITVLGRAPEVRPIGAFYWNLTLNKEHRNLIYILSVGGVRVFLCQGHLNRTVRPSQGPRDDHLIQEYKQDL